MLCLAMARTLPRTLPTTGASLYAWFCVPQLYNTIHKWVLTVLLSKNQGGIHKGCQFGGVVPTIIHLQFNNSSSFYALTMVSIVMVCVTRSHHHYYTNSSFSLRNSKKLKIFNCIECNANSILMKTFSRH
jgi:hypothetical protein